MLVEAENDVYYTIRYLVFSVNFRGLFHQVQQFSNKVYIPLVCSMVQGRPVDRAEHECEALHFSQLCTSNRVSDYITDSTYCKYTYAIYIYVVIQVILAKNLQNTYLQLLNLVR